MLIRLFAAAWVVLCLPGALSAADADSRRTETAVLAGGCFWCIEADYEKLDGVLDVVSGYTGGHVENPTYKQVSAGGTGHLEVVRIVYDSDRVSYRDILAFFYRHVDPTRDDGQFCDSGPQYRPAIFYRDLEQRAEALAYREVIRRTKPFPEAVKMEILPLDSFYPAEDYHQDYSRKNPLRYMFYRYRCGRDARLEALWGEP